VPREGLSEADFEWLLDTLKEYEEWGTILVNDKELYDYIKSIATMNVIVGH
jgi:protease II